MARWSTPRRLLADLEVAGAQEHNVISHAIEKTPAAVAKRDSYARPDRPRSNSTRTLAASRERRDEGESAERAAPQQSASERAAPSAGRRGAFTKPPSADARALSSRMEARQATQARTARESQRERMTTVASLEAAAAVAAMSAEAADVGADAQRPGDDAASSRLAEASALVSAARP